MRLGSIAAPDAQIVRDSTRGLRCRIFYELKGQWQIAAGSSGKLEGARRGRVTTLPAFSK